VCRYRYDVVLILYRYTRRLCAIPRQCVSVERPNATTMRLPPYVLHSRGFYRGKMPPPPSPPPPPTVMWVVAAVAPGDVNRLDRGTRAPAHNRTHCWSVGWPHIRVRREKPTCACTFDLYSRTLLQIYRVILLTRDTHYFKNLSTFFKTYFYPVLSR